MSKPKSKRQINPVSEPKPQPPSRELMCVFAFRLSQADRDAIHAAAGRDQATKFVHTAVTNVYRASRDLFLAQRFARHVSPLTTTIYTHPSDQEMWEKVRRLSC